MAVSGIQKQFIPQHQLLAWSPFSRIIFRLTFSYFVLYNLPFPLNLLPNGFVGYDNLWNAVTPKVGRWLLHRTIDTAPNGSGDTTALWVQAFCFLVLALLSTITWTLLDRRATNYVRLCDWLTVYVRFALATAMISYGAAKVFPTQFPLPSLHRLMSPSEMRRRWDCSGPLWEHRQPTELLRDGLSSSQHCCLPTEAQHSSAQ